MLQDEKLPNATTPRLMQKRQGCLGQTKHRGQVCVDVKLLSRLILSTFKIVLLKGIRQLLGVLNFKRIADQKMPLVYARVR